MYTHYAGIDLHKRSSTWVIINAQRDVVWEDEILCTPQDLKEGLSRCPVPFTSTQATIEPVCGWQWYMDTLISAGIHTVLANPTKVRLIAESKHKTDKNDARMLAELLSTGYLPTAYRAPDDIQSLRALVRERYYLIALRTGIKNRIKGVVTRSGMHDIMDTCLTGIGRAYAERFHLGEITDLHALMTELTTYTRRLERDIARTLKDYPLDTLIRSVPVVGTLTAGTVIAEVGDFSRFKSPKQLGSYAGLVPRQRSSGERARYGSITKVGSKYLRHTLVEAAMRFRTHHDPVLYGWYEQIKRTHSPMKARVALARKLLTIMWYMVKTNTPYTPRQHIAE